MSNFYPSVFSTVPEDSSPESVPELFPEEYSSDEPPLEFSLFFLFFLFYFLVVSVSKVSFEKGNFASVGTFWFLASF